jgi:hypothetical protein
LEDYLAPLLGMSPAERAMYAHLLRHSQLEGRPGLMISARALALGVGLQLNAAKLHLFALARKGCVRVKRWRGKYAVEVFLPEEVARNLTPENWTRVAKEPGRVSRNPAKRETILRRERGRCFYCLRKLPPDKPWFDHVVPLSEGGSPAEDNVVACCERCNRWKHTRSAAYLLGKLRSAGVLTRTQVAARKRALRKLKQKWGKEKVEMAA